MYEALAVTVPGIEDFLAEELMELHGINSEIVLPGKLKFSTDPETLLSLNYRSRIAHRFLLLLAKWESERLTLEEVYRVSSEVSWSDYFDPNSTFAVRVDRHGKHDFTSVEVAATVGKAVVDHFMAQGSRIRANLREPDVIIRGYVSENLFLLGIDTTGKSLHMRGYRKFMHRAPLNPCLASALVRATGWLRAFKDHNFVDPMCGGGTIAIEAALAAKNVPPGFWRRKYPVDHVKQFSGISQEELFRSIDQQIREMNPEVYCMDISPKYLVGAITNSISAGVRLRFSVADASELGLRLKRIGAVSMNPPYELRLGPSRKLGKTFREMMKHLSEKLELKMSVVVGGPAIKKFMEAARVMNILIVKRVTMGGIEAKLLVLSRRGK